MLLASLFVSVARTLTQTGHAKVSRQEEHCSLLTLPSDLIVAALLPHLSESQDLASRKHMVFCLSCSGLLGRQSEASCHPGKSGSQHTSPMLQQCGIEKAAQ